MKAVVVNDDGKILILREAATYKDGNNTGRYHMPGGRVEPGENFEEALHREVHEETGLKIKLLYPIYVGEWRPVIRNVPHHIVATFIVCKPASSSDIVLSTEHDHFAWIVPHDRTKYDIMDPEDKVIEAYISRID